MLLRSVLPKKTSFASLDQEAVSLMCSHVNSYARPILGNKAPMDYAAECLPEGLTKLMGVERIDGKEILLKPSLLSRWFEG